MSLTALFDTNGANLHIYLYIMFFIVCGKHKHIFLLHESCSFIIKVANTYVFNCLDINSIN